jgi:hypothetical protein
MALSISYFSIKFNLTGKGLSERKFLAPPLLKVMPLKTPVTEFALLTATFRTSSNIIIV